MQIILGLLIIALIFCAIVATQPNAFRITRSLPMNATAQAIFAQVNDLQQWNAWSPWAKLDPQMKNTFEGPQSGAGAITHWTGNKRVGEGSMTIMESRPSEYIAFKLDFLRPFKAMHMAEFTFRPEGGHTVVTWSMTGSRNFISKAIVMLLNCDQMVGKQFEQGLASLCAIVETA